MKLSKLLLVVLVGCSGISSVSRADRLGVEYSAASDALIYGGSRYYFSSRSPDDVQTLYVRNSGAVSGEVMFNGEGALTDIRASHQAGLVGVVERLLEMNVAKERANYVSRQYDERGNLVEVYHYEDARLLLLNLNGEVLHRIPGVRRYAWSPEGDQIAYITGRFTEDGVGFETTGAWLYDIESKQATQIHEGGLDIQWALWDNNVYIYDPANEEFPESIVYRFDVAEGSAGRTSFKGIYFSPDGTYYYDPGYDAASIRIFRTQTGEQVSVDLSLPSAGAVRTANSAVGWLDDNTLILPTPIQGEGGDYLYDVVTTTLWQADGLIIPTPRLGDSLLVMDGADVDEVPKNALRLVR